MGPLDFSGSFDFSVKWKVFNETIHSSMLHHVRYALFLCREFNALFLCREFNCRNLVSVVNIDT